MARRSGFLLLLLSACTPQRPASTQTFSGFRTLTDGIYHAGNQLPLWGFYVLGSPTDDGFAPVSEVLGRGEIGEAGTYGWMQLADGSFRASQPTLSPERPFVPGYLSNDGTFAPSSQHVVR